ncbi:MAG TPA: carboxymuconolactone decarboxylase family protein [Blastocatellia bacterium]|jgi:alkylhydroperoxidase family enzyme
MRPLSTLVILIALVVCCEALALPRVRDDRNAGKPPVISIAELEKQARRGVETRSRLLLAAENSDLFNGIDSLEPPGSGRVPNYLRALAALPGAVKPFARLMKVAIYNGVVAPEIKMGMGLSIAQIHSSPYVATHMQRMLAASERGKTLLSCMRSGDYRTVSPAENLALGYADSLTRDVHGVSDEDFQKLRAYFNDSQIVELTMTVSFFNYFTRFCEAARLPVERWAIDGPSFNPQAFTRYEMPVARVALISNDEIDAISGMAVEAKDPAKQAAGLGLGVANSQRAMMRCPQFALAWRAYSSQVRQYESVSRELKLHISFAVSMANGCRYCTLHQVLGLRRLNVNPAKLMAMKKDDEVLTARELTAVQFARKLTRSPTSITDSDFERLKAEFAEQGAIEVLLQACAFNFMNRFTDGLRLPSEEEAIRVYKEVYGVVMKK